MVNALFDTNVLIDYLNGIDEADQELSRYARRAISIITWMEVLAGTGPQDAAAVRAWLRSFEVLALELLLVSRNTKDFPETEPGIRVPYALPKH